MAKSLVRALIVVAFSLFAAPIEGLAQTSHQDVAPSLKFVKAQVAPGEIVYVTDATSTTMKGKLIGITDDAIAIRVNQAAKSIRAIDVSRIQWQKQDSPLNGVLIGAAIGATPGIYWLLADPNECTGPCAEDYVAIGVGALVGGLIDRAIKKKVTIYDAASRRTKITFSSLLMHHRGGVQVAVTF
jgi:hypothetical protein